MTLLVHVRGVEFDEPTANQRVELANAVFDVLHENMDIYPDEVVVSPGEVYVVQAPNPNEERDIVEVYSSEEAAEANAGEIVEASDIIERGDISVERRLVHRA